jgi:hypothetical protein
MSTVKLTNVSNPAVFAVEWTAEESGNRYQLVNPRDSETLLFGMWREDEQQRWATTPVVAPSRFGMDGPPKSFRTFLAIANTYVNG